MKKSALHFCISLLVIGIIFSSYLLVQAADKDTQTVSAAAFSGKWSEHWGTPGQTDVTYHDQYQITPADNGNVKVAIINRNQVIENERVENNTLTFTQHTDAFAVEYSLTMQPDNKWMTGTATTPAKVVRIKWKRIN